MSTQRRLCWTTLGCLTAFTVLSACGEDESSGSTDRAEDTQAERDVPIDEADETPGPDTPIDGTADAGPERLHLTVATNEDGTIDLLDSEGKLFLRQGRAEVLVETADGDVSIVSGQDCVGEWTDLEEPASSNPAFSRTVGQRFECESQGIGLVWDVFLDGPNDVVLAGVTVDNQSGSEVTVLRLTPLFSEGADGGLFVGLDPMRHRILDNGSDVVNDIDVKLHFPDEQRNPLVGGILDTPSRGNIVANWNYALVDLDSDSSWIAGTLDVVQAIPTMGLVYQRGASNELIDEANGRAGFHAFYADMVLEFFGKPLADGESLRSETVYVDPMAPDAWTGLEDYAQAIGDWLEIELWTDRDGGRPVPNGWNSWTGSGSTGGLGTDIDEALMREELAVMAREFAPFGIDYFQIDDGYAVVEGDWVTRDDRFPSGMPAFSQAIQDAGLIPGIWISPFLASVDSSLAEDHPTWLTDPDDNVMMGLYAPDSDLRTLDLSNDDVIEWLSATTTRYRDEWDMGWLKLDFGYFAALYPPIADPSLTAMEAYRRGIEAVGDALGEDVFYMGIGLMGVNYGVVDTMRLTLDNGPLWEESDPFSLFGDGNNFKNGVRVAARRYFLNHRVWISHADLLFFRTDRAHPEPVVTMEEATTLASFMGLSGAIVKFGEDLRTLTPEQINVWRRLLPIYPAGARPMDLFTRHYPEQYLLPIDGTLAGSDAAWTVIGLLNWGRNYDYDADRVEMADEGRTYEIDLGEWGLDPEQDYLATEFWRESFEGIVTGELEYEVPAHGHAVITLRPATGAPQFLGHNRHFTQGATDLVEEAWDDEAQTLSVSLEVDAGSEDAVPFEYRLRFYVPEGYTFLEIALPGIFEVEDSVLTYRFTPTEPGRLDLELGFAQ